MEILKNKAVAIAFSFFLMFAVAISLLAIPAASANDPPWEIKTFASYVKISSAYGEGAERTLDNKR